MHFINSIPSCKYNKGYKPLQIQINYIYPKYFFLLSRTLSIGTKEQLKVVQGSFIISFHYLSSMLHIEVNLNTFEKENSKCSNLQETCGMC